MAQKPAPHASERTLKYQTLALKVSIHCEGCEKKVKKVLQSIDGVYKVAVNSQLHKVTVIGNVGGDTLIKKLAKAGKLAVLWPEIPDKLRDNSGKSNDKKKHKNPKDSQDGSENDGKTGNYDGNKQSSPEDGKNGDVEVEASQPPNSGSIKNKKGGKSNSENISVHGQNGSEVLESPMGSMIPDPQHKQVYPYESGTYYAPHSTNELSYNTKSFIPSCYAFPIYSFSDHRDDDNNNGHDYMSDEDDGGCSVM